VCPTSQDVDRAIIEDHTIDWPETPRALADDLVATYGVPDEATPHRLIWHEAGDWKRIHLSREGTPHDFPQPHEDYLQGTIDYPIDPGDVDDLIAFDGSISCSRTRGELSVECRSESMNFITVNLAHDVVTGRKTVEEAREAFAKLVVEARLGQDPAYARGIQFEAPEDHQGDPGEAIVAATLTAGLSESLAGVPDEEREGDSKVRPLWRTNRRTHWRSG